MKRTITCGTRLAAAMFLTMLPTLSRADCVPTGVNGTNVPFTLMTLNNAQEATYATGNLTVSTVGGVGGLLEWGENLSATQATQLFSDRTYCPSPDAQFCVAPFSVLNPDQIGLTISDITRFTFGGLVTTIGVTLTLESHGNTQYKFTGACAPTGELYGTFNGNTYAVIAFGQPYGQP